MRLKAVVRHVVLWGLSFAFVGLTQAQEFPNRAIKVLVGFPPGGSTDAAMRVLAERATKLLGQPVVVENRAGAGGTISVVAAKVAPPDGYTLLLVTNAQFKNALVQKVEYDNFKDFTYIIGLSELVFGVVSRTDAPWKDWNGLIDYARRNPGKVSYGVPAGLLAAAHIVMAEVGAQAKLDWQPVPYKGSRDALQGLLAGDIAVMSDASISFGPQVDAGKIKLYAMATEKRFALYPDTPTLRDLGYDFHLESPWGLAGQDKMPDVAVRKIHDAFKIALADPVVLKFLTQVGQVPKYEGPAEYTASSKALMERERARLQRLGLMPKQN